ncbi:MAG: c-type cytochrome [Candidatus Rokubacteria bacterium]|nr:c-type cytochrome [Candidatus Rokubacteria bacterium]
MSRMVAMLIACALAGLLSAGAEAQPLFTPTQDPLAGARVFGAKGCTRCHAVNGVGPSVGPDLGRIPRPRTFYDLAAALWNHARPMADRMRQLGIARPHLDGRETGDLVAFLFTLDYFDPPGNADTGRRLFTEKRCIACHQVAGTGGVVGPSLDTSKSFESPLDLAAAMWNHGPQMADAMRARNIPRPVFTASELRDIVAFVAVRSSAPSEGGRVVLPGRAEVGRQLFADKRCVLCHDDRSGAPNLGERAANRSLGDFAAAMWNKAPAMAAAMKQRGISVPQLSATEVADLVAYFYAARYFAGSGNPTNGVRLAASKGCLDCHGLRGERGKRASDLAKARGTETPASIMAALWNHSFIGSGGPAPPLSTVTGEEMADLIAFLTSLRMRAQ